MKKIIISAVLLVAVLAQAKDHVIVVRGATFTNPDKTEVSGGGNLSDTLTVHPAIDCSTIFVALKDPDGATLVEQQCAAVWNDLVTIIAPANLPHGYFLEVRDDRGFLYREFNQ